MRPLKSTTVTGPASRYVACSAIFPELPVPQAPCLGAVPSPRRPFVELPPGTGKFLDITISAPPVRPVRSEEHTSELQSRGHLVCRLLLEKKKKKKKKNKHIIITTQYPY